jgi:hypothetical protein
MSISKGRAVFAESSMAVTLNGPKFNLWEIPISSIVQLQYVYWINSRNISLWVWGILQIGLLISVRNPVR